MLPTRLPTTVRGTNLSIKRVHVSSRRWLSSSIHLQCNCTKITRPQQAAHDELPPTDYRSIGEKHELFSSSIYSRGSTFFHPDGAHIFRKLQAFLRAQYITFGFQEVITPLLYKPELWEKSGHAQNYKDDMFEVTGASESSNAEMATHNFGLKPMNCPGHCLLFSRHQKSHRDLPIRYAEFSPLHRNENDGALSGLTRARCFHQDDGHIFCTPDQVGKEIRKTLDFVKLIYKIFDLGQLKFVLSTRPEHKYIGDAVEWDRAETQLKTALDDSTREWKETAADESRSKEEWTQWTLNPGDGAFYGPKIDIILTDRTGKEHQTATIQLDFQLPQRFHLSYDGPDGRPERPVMIHRAILGSIERFMALLIERYQNRWPFWLSPRQAIILTVNSDHVDYAREIFGKLGGSNGKCQPWRPRALASRSYRIDGDFTDSTIGAKVRSAKMKGYNLILIIGANEVLDSTVSVNFEGQKNPDAVKRIVTGLQHYEVGKPSFVPGRTRLQSDLILPLMTEFEDQFL